MNGVHDAFAKLEKDLSWPADELDANESRARPAVAALFKGLAGHAVSAFYITWGNGDDTWSNAFATIDVTTGVMRVLVFWSSG